MAGSSKVDFKSYESMHRLLCSLIAINSGMRIDFKALAKLTGSTESSLEHRTRIARGLGPLLRACLEADLDPADVARAKGIPLDGPNGLFGADKAALQKHFGGSTADGLAFQFRGIKNGAEVLKNAVANDEDPVEAFSGSMNGTPRGKGGRSAGSSAPTTPSAGRAGQKRKLAPTPTPKSASKRKVTTGKGKSREPDTTKNESSEKDYDELDPSPEEQFARRRPKVPFGTSPVISRPGPTISLAEDQGSGLTVSRGSTLPTETEVSTPISTQAAAPAHMAIEDDGIVGTRLFDNKSTERRRPGEGLVNTVANPGHRQQANSMPGVTSFSMTTAQAIASQQSSTNGYTAAMTTANNSPFSSQNAAVGSVNSSFMMPAYNGAGYNGMGYDNYGYHQQSNGSIYRGGRHNPHGFQQKEESFFDQANIMDDDESNEYDAAGEI